MRPPVFLALLPFLLSPGSRFLSRSQQLYHARVKRVTGITGSSLSRQTTDDRQTIESECLSLHELNPSFELSCRKRPNATCWCCRSRERGTRRQGGRAPTETKSKPRRRSRRRFIRSTVRLKSRSRPPFWLSLSTNQPKQKTCLAWRTKTRVGEWMGMCRVCVFRVSCPAVETVCHRWFLFILRLATYVSSRVVPSF